MFMHVFLNDDLQAFADLFDDVKITRRVEAEGIRTTTGDHPVYGTIVEVQSWERVIVRSDGPLCATDWAMAA